MIRLHIILDDYWNIIVYYKVDHKSIKEIRAILEELECKQSDINDSVHTLLDDFNTGMTYSNPEYRTSIICISKTTSNDQFINTIVHEAKHVQSAICNYYNISEDGEQAAYLIGYILQKMYKSFKYML